jgi:glycosyltransferase involved in cell wall biosynthesis
VHVVHLKAMDFLVLSHLRWDFVFQRPQHLLTRCAQTNRVFFWEEPVFDSERAFVDERNPSPGLHVLVPHLPAGLAEDENHRLQSALLARLRNEHSIKNDVVWYYTPMSLNFTRELSPIVTIYDCMDELSAFRGAPPGLRLAEAELFSRADLVFTGGQSLFQSKRSQHHSVHCLASSIDYPFFASARTFAREPEDQSSIPHPRLGYCGVIDERIDLPLLDAIAEARPDWHLVMVGPVVKISPSDLPARPNIHYLGGRRYEQLPAYMSGWHVGLLPFAINESTRFISPTKTPEYLAAGLPVVSTPITDVVDPYGEREFVHIAGTPDKFIQAIEAALPTKHSVTRLSKADAFLAQNSWDLTWRRMARLIDEVIGGRTQRERTIKRENHNEAMESNILQAD